MTERVLQLRIHGRVQGVGYRAALFAQAQRLGVRGWVRNRRDGTVQAVLAGTDDAVQGVLEWARQGPPSESAYLPPHGAGRARRRCLGR